MDCYHCQHALGEDPSTRLPQLAETKELPHPHPLKNLAPLFLQRRSPLPRSSGVVQWKAITLFCGQQNSSRELVERTRQEDLSKTLSGLTRSTIVSGDQGNDMIDVPVKERLYHSPTDKADRFASDQHENMRIHEHVLIVGPVPLLHLRHVVSHPRLFPTHSNPGVIYVYR